MVVPFKRPGTIDLVVTLPTTFTPIHYGTNTVVKISVCSVVIIKLNCYSLLLSIFISLVSEVTVGIPSGMLGRWDNNIQGRVNVIIILIMFLMFELMCY